MRIKNINEKYGEQVVFDGQDLTECIASMATAIVNCGEEISNGQTVNDLCFQLRDGIDYDIQYDKQSEADHIRCDDSEIINQQQQKEKSR